MILAHRDTPVSHRALRVSLRDFFKDALGLAVLERMQPRYRALN